MDWTVFDSKTIKIKIATGVGGSRGEGTFVLDNDGLICARQRTLEANGWTLSHPWRGRFWDYQPVGERLMPCKARPNSRLAYPMNEEIEMSSMIIPTIR